MGWNPDLCHLVFIFSLFRARSALFAATATTSGLKVCFVKFFLIMSCLLITLNNCLKGHKSLGLLLGGVLKMSLSLSLSLLLSFSLSLSLSIFFGQVMSPHHSDQMSQWSQVSRIAFCMSISKVLS